ncbi:MAG: class I SAM-dependent methyltransferase [Gammaproteobacteria bacterium]
MTWLQTVLGRSLLAQEQAATTAVLERVFGDQLLQIGSWGESDTFLSSARTQFSALLAEQPGAGVSGVVMPQQLPILTDSVDAVLLPHTLELAEEPHSVLREVDRILRPDGKLIVLGFNPVSWFGLRNALAAAGYPPGLQRQIRSRRLQDWLQLLNLKVESLTGCYASASAGRMVNLLRRWNWCASVYILVASKESIPMTVIRPRLRRRARLVEGLVNPTTRNAA